MSVKRLFSLHCGRDLRFQFAISTTGNYPSDNTALVPTISITTVYGFFQ